LCNFDMRSCFWISWMDWNLRLHSRQHICVRSANSETESMDSVGSVEVTVVMAVGASAFNSCRLVAHFSSWAAGFLATATDSILRFFFCWSELAVVDSRFAESSVVGFVTRTGSMRQH